jgi:hypothetical protein
MEELVLTDPIVDPGTTVTKYKMLVLTLGLKMEMVPGQVGTIFIQLEDEHGGKFTHTYSGQTAIDFIKYINTANFSTTSLNKRILQKLSNDGVIPGTVTGAPDP